MLSGPPLPPRGKKTKRVARKVTIRYWSSWVLVTLNPLFCPPPSPQRYLCPTSSAESVAGLGPGCLARGYILPRYRRCTVPQQARASQVPVAGNLGRLRVTCVSPFSHHGTTAASPAGHPLPHDVPQTGTSASPPLSSPPSDSFMANNPLFSSPLRPPRTRPTLVLPNITDARRPLLRLECWPSTTRYYWSGYLQLSRPPSASL